MKTTFLVNPVSPLEFMEDITDTEGNDVDVIYLDFTKAFDNVLYRRLLEK